MGAPSGALAVRTAADLARLWEAYSQGGTRQVAQSAGRTGLTTYQAKVQRATKGYATMLIAHALEQQRRWHGVEAAVQRSLRGASSNEASSNIRSTELAAWKEVVSVLQTGLAPLLACLEGSEHLMQGLYAGLREPLSSMFKELHKGWQQHGRYQGEA